MTTGEQHADAIIQRFNEGPRGGYTQAFNEIRDAQRDDPNFWRQHGQRINDQIDFRQLGFSSDFQITGLNNRGQLMTSDNGGASQQLRSAQRLDVVGTRAGSTEGELWGNNGRRFQTDANGRTTFTVGQGDYLDRIAGDVVAHNSSRTPSQQDILRAREAIARENNIRDVNHIPQGTQLRIPESLINPQPRPGEPVQPGQPGQGPRGMRAESSRPAAEGGVYSPFAPPGAATDAGMLRSLSTFAEGDRTNQQTRQGANGRDVTSYDTLIGTLGNRRNASVSEEVNRTTGVLERRSVNYPQGDVSMYVRNAEGNSQYLENVRNVNIVRNPNGEYTSTYTLSNGQVYEATTGTDGRTRYFTQRQPR